MVDRRGRVPFAVLGVFLVVGSAVTSGIITNLEKERSMEIPLSLSTISLEYTIKNVEADLSRILAYSCLRALKQVGETPVIHSTLPTKVAQDYADFNENGGYDSGDLPDHTIDSKEEILKFNRNWARNMARVYMNQHINTTFQQPIYTGEEYALTIYDPDNNGAMDDWRDITFQQVAMKVDRTTHIDLLISEDTDSYDTYWTATAHGIGVQIEHLRSGESWVKWLNISCLIPSRLPLLMGLTDTYQESITGPLSPLMGLVTAMGAGYTEVRSLLQYAGKYDWVKNIVDNRWLQYLTNTALLGIQYVVFNSIDPMALAQLALQVNDLVSKGTRYDTGTLSDIITSTVSLPIDHQENIFKTVGQENESAAHATLNQVLTNGDPARGNASLWALSRGILNESETIYYYHNHSVGFCNQTEWKGYSFMKDGHIYRLSLQGENPDRHGVVSGTCFTRRYSDEVNHTIQKKIQEEISRTYSANFSTRVEKRRCADEYSPCLDGNWRFLSADEWDLVASEAKGPVLKEGHLPPSLPYVENWTLYWERKERWEHREGPQNWVAYDVIHYYNETATFYLHADPRHWDVAGVFVQKSVGTPPYTSTHTDDNLQFLLEKYVDGHFTTWRDYYTNTAKDSGRNISLLADTQCWQNNTADGDTAGREKIAWVEEEARAALWNITQLIKEDREEYSKISAHFYADGTTTVNLSLMEKERQALWAEFQRHKERYIHAAYYKQGNRYHSAAARAIATIREWFVGEIERRLQTSYRSQIEEKINERLGRCATHSGVTYGNYQNGLDTYKKGVDQLTSIQFGHQMELSNEQWRENITVAVSAVPDYFDFEATPSGEEKWEFNVKNICLFGPTGLPVLPTPITPWIVTVNAWYIHVDGHWDSFTVLDSTDETHPHAVFGHCSQTYCRKDEIVYDRVCHPHAPDSRTKLGRNLPLHFEVETMSVGIVPPGKLPIGDLDQSVEWDRVGNEAP